MLDYSNFTETDYRYNLDNYDLYGFYADMSISNNEVCDREVAAYEQAQKLGCEDVFCDNAKAPQLKRKFTVKDSTELLDSKTILKLEALEASDRLQMEAYLKEQARKFRCAKELVEKLELEKKAAAKAESAYKSYSNNDKLSQLIKDYDFFSLIASTVGNTGKKVRNEIQFNPCPICGHKDNFYYNPDKKIFYCFSHGVGGSVIDFLMKTRNMSKSQAIEYFKFELCGLTKPERSKKGVKVSKGDYPQPEYSSRERREYSFKSITPDKTILERLKECNPQNYQYNDIGASRLFTDVFRNELRYSTTEKKWYCYTGKVWTVDEGGMKAGKKAVQLYEALMIYSMGIEDNEKANMFYDFYGNYCKLKYRETLIKDAMKECTIKSVDFDRQKNLFNCQNGTFNLDTYKLQPHNPEDYLTQISNVVYDESAVSKDWSKFLADVFPYDAYNKKACDRDAMQYFQKAIGYSLHGDNSLETCFILYGETTRNGKGTAMNTVVHMLGDYAKTAQPETLAVKKNKDGGTPSADIARLVGCRLVNMSEPDQSMIFDAGLLKQLTGRDPVTTRYLYGNPFTYSPQYTIWINTNHLPKVADETVFEGDRINVIPFIRHFEANERNSHLKDTLKTQENISGIFNWCIEGLKLFRSEGLKRSYTVATATAEYAKTWDKIQSFIDECLEEKKESGCTGIKVFDRYKNWCKDSGYIFDGKNKFFSKLTKKGLLQKRAYIGGRQCYNVVQGYIIKGTQ